MVNGSAGRDFVIPSTLLDCETDLKTQRYAEVGAKGAENSFAFLREFLCDLCV